MYRCIPSALSLLLLCSALISCQKKVEPSLAETPKPASTTLAAALDAQLAEAKALADSGAVEQAVAQMYSTLQLAADSLGEPHPRTALLQHELGNLFNNHLQNLDSALLRFQLAAGQRQKLLLADPSLAPELAKTYFALARVQRQMGRLQPALDDVQRCLALREAARPQDFLRLGRTCLEAGVLYRESGDLENALRYLGQSVTYFQQDSVGNAADLANAWNETAATHDRLRQPDNASVFYQKALETYRSLGDQEREAGCLNDLGGALLRSGNLEAAQPVLESALRLNGQLLAADSANSRLLLARSATLDNLGICHKKWGRAGAAISAAEQSLGLALRACGTRFHPAVAGSYDNLGNALSAAGRHEEALKAYQTGIGSLVPSFQEADYLKNPPLTSAAVSEKPLLLTLLRDKAEALPRLSSFPNLPTSPATKAAFEAWRSVDTLLLQIRQGCREDGSKYFLSEEAAPMYEQALTMAFDFWAWSRDTAYRNAALALCERNKAGVLLESLNALRAKPSANGSKGEGAAGKEQSLRQAIARQELALMLAQQSSDAAAVQAGQDSLFALKRAMERMERHLEQEAPGWLQQKFALAQSPQTYILQSQLPEGTALVEYFLGEKNLFSITLTRRSTYLCRSALPTNFLELAGQFRRSVSDWDFIGKQPELAEDAYLNSAHALFKLLLQSPLDSLAGEKIGCLIVVPDGALGYLPFEALLTAPADNWKQRGLPFLLRQYAVSYAYSAHFLSLAQGSTARQGGGKGFAGFGLSYDERTLQAASDLQNRSADAVTLAEFLRGTPGKLPYSAQEVSEVAGLLGGRSWLDTAATKANFLRHAPGSDILHFAGHGFTDAENPLNSALLFSKNSDSSDCLLRAADLYGLRLNASLTVLSACNTGSGELRRGEGIMSFARAFAGAGVPSVVMSLWSVTDASTASVMGRFYASLKKGEAKDLALREAKLGYLDSATPERSLPIYWAGAVLMGDASPMRGGGGLAIWAVWGGLALAGTALIFMAMQRGFFGRKY